MTRERITEDWLRANGFKWHQLERQSHKMWTLWIGDAVGEGGFSSFEDLGIEVCNAAHSDTFGLKWNCWFRSDYAHRYTRFIHIRYLEFVDELAALFEGITGLPFDAANNIGGSAYRCRAAMLLRTESERIDLRWLREARKWNEVEKDDTRGRALPEHYEAYENAKKNYEAEKAKKKEPA